MTLINRLFSPQLPPSLSLFLKEKKVSDKIPLTHFVAPSIFETRTGALGFIVQVQGLPFELESHGELNVAQNQWAFLIKNLGDAYQVYQTIHRHKTTTTLEGEYPAGFAQHFSHTYHQQFQDAPLFINDIYLSFMLKPAPVLIKKGLGMLNRLGLEPDDRDQKALLEERVQTINQTITSLMQSLSAYEPRLLSTSNNGPDREGDNSEILRFLSILVNSEAREFFLPRTHVARILPRKRLFFGGRAIHFEGVVEAQHRYGTMLSIKQFYPKSRHGYFNGLLSLPFEYIQTQSYQGLPKNTSLEMIRRQQSKLVLARDPSRTQIDELNQAADDIASDRMTFGRHHHTLLILSSDLNALEQSVAQADQVYNNMGTIAIRETLNLENAFWAQLPDNGRYICRQSPISSHNFSCFAPLHNFYTGYVDQNHLGSAVMLAETRSQTPFFFNLHERASGSKVDLPKGSTLLIGAPNAGKTVILLTTNLMMQKYGMRSFIFDRNHGCEIYVHAMNGIYHTIDGKSPTGWNPCQLDDTPANRTFLRDLITQLVARPEQRLTPEDENQIADVVDRNFSLPRAKRNLTNISAFFRMDFSGRQALQKWLRLPDRTGRMGEYAWVFDNEEDTLDVSHRIMGFDMTALLNQGDQTASHDVLITPCMMYLFKRIELSLDGTLTSINLDEGWQFLEQPYWKAKIAEYEATVRKNNALLFFATQFPDLLAKSSLASSLIQGSATHLFLANPKAQVEDYRGSFKLSHKEFEFIKNTPPSLRYFLIKQGHESAIIRFNFKHMSRTLSVLSGNALTVPIARQARLKKGPDPKAWLPEFYRQVGQL